MVFRELDLGFNILRSNISRLPVPYKLTFALTYACNSRCTTCGIWKTQPENELSTGEIQEFFEKNTYFNWIDLTGGEIFLRKDIEEVFEIVLKNSPKLYTLHFPTNGLMPEKIEQITTEIVPKVARKLVITVSLDGPTEVHDQIRGVPGGWDKAVETFKRLRPIPKVEAYFGMTLSKDNVGLVDETIQSVKNQIPSISPRDFHVNIAHTSTSYYHTEGEIEFDKKEAARQIQAFRSKKGWHTPVLWLEQKYLKKVPNYLSTGVTPLPCKAASVSCFIDPKGIVYPCTMWDKPLGSLRENNFDLKKMWASKKFKDAAINALKKKCPNCWTPCEAYQTILANVL